MRLAFMGSPDFAVPVLEAILAAGHEVAAVYAQPARPKGRGMKMIPTPVAKAAAAHGLTVRTPKTLKNAEAQADFAALNIDAAVVVAYGLLLPKAVLDVPKLGCFNLHASLLPRWRGAAPIQRAILAGDEKTGVMVMHLDEGLDTGPVIATAEVEIGRKTADELEADLAKAGAPLMVSALADLAAGQAVEVAQSAEGACYAKKIDKAETRIDWTKSADEVDRAIRAFGPKPGAWCLARRERLKLLLAEPVKGSGKPGEVLSEEPTLACGSGALKLLKVQRAGRGMVSAADFQRGFALKKGEVLE